MWEQHSLLACRLLQCLPSHDLRRLCAGIILLARTNALADSKDCLQIDAEKVCERATASFGMPSRPGFVKVEGVLVSATNETCYAAVTQAWQRLISETRAWGDLLLVVNVIMTMAVLCMGYHATFDVSCEVPEDQLPYGNKRPSVKKYQSQPSGVTEACLLLGVIFLFPAGVVYLVRACAIFLAHSVVLSAECSCLSRARGRQVTIIGKSAKLDKACEDSADLAVIQNLNFAGGALLFWQCCVFVPAAALFHKLSRQGLPAFSARSKRGHNDPQP